MPTLSVQRVNVDEGNASAGGPLLTFRVSLSQASDEEITFSYMFFHDTSSIGDLAGNPGLGPWQGTIIAGETYADVSVRVQGDKSIEVDELLWLELFNPVGADLAGGALRLTTAGVIADDDDTGSDLALFVGNPNVVERDDGTHVAVFEILLSRAHTSGMTFNFRTVDGSATEGSDYVAETGTVSFLAGETSKSVEVVINGDGVVEAAEFFSLVVTPTDDIKNGTLGSTGVATIIDDDTAVRDVPTLSIERVALSETNLSGSGPVLTFLVTLSEAIDEEVTVAYAGRHGSTLAADFKSGTTLGSGTLTIEAGQTTGVIKVHINGDKADEVDEGFWLDLFNPKGAILAGEQPKITALGIISDDDGSGSNLALFVSDATIREGDSGDTSAVFQIHLSHGYETDLTFTYQTSDGTAKAGGDYAATSGSVTFLAGQTMASVEVAVKGDQLLENSESFSLVLTATSEIKNTAASHVGTATIIDDDSPDEVIEGDEDNDELFGFAGNDSLFGYGGNDTLDGGTGKDELFGGEGKDVLIGGTGRDAMQGDGGGDTFVFRSTSESGVKVATRDTIMDFSSSEGDVIDLSGIDANSGAKGNQAFKFIGTDEFSRAGTLRYERTAEGVVVYGNTDRDGKAEFSLLVEDVLSLRGADFDL